jgi:TolB-like protein
MKTRIPFCFLSLLLSISGSTKAQQQKRVAGTWPTLSQRSSSAINPQGNLDTRIGELSKQISDGLTENQKRTIAVVEFGDLDGRVTTLGRFLAEELITRLYQTKKFKVIERQLLNKVIAEQKLSLTGVIEQSAAQRLGKVLGVDAIASGTVTDLGKTLRVNARLIDTATGEIFAVASTEILKDETVIKLIGGASDRSSGNDSAKPEDNQPKSSTLKLDAQFFTFELVQCKQSGGTVICDLDVTNKEGDRELGFSAVNSQLFDEFGNRINGVETKVANKDSGGMGYISNVLLGGVKTRVRIGFQNVAASATKASLLDLQFYLGDLSTFQVRFRNVKLVK